MKKLLRQAMPPVKNDAEPGRDLWPDMLRRLNANPAENLAAKHAAPAMPGWACFNSAWFDGALLAGLVALAAFFPATIPLFLYYL